MESIGSVENDLNSDTELRLGLPGSREDDEQQQQLQEITMSKTHAPPCCNNKRSLSSSDNINAAEESQKLVNNSEEANIEDAFTAPAAKSQIIGWPPVRSSRKNIVTKKNNQSTEGGGKYVKVSMDGAPYLRKIDLKGYNNYSQLLKALENMFNLKIGKYMEKEGYKGSEYAPAYEDKDGDLMLVGDVPWDMFISYCNRLRIIKAPGSGSGTGSGSGSSSIDT